MGFFTKEVQQLYVAFFNRPADIAGLQYWEGVVTAQGGKTDAVSAAFAQSEEYLTTYRGLSNSQLVNQVYMNLFGRPAEQGGLDYWTPLLDQHLLTIDNVTTAVGRGALGGDAVAFRAKVEAASIFTDNLRFSGQGNAYTGATVNQLLKNFINTVTDSQTQTKATAPDNLKVVVENVVNVFNSAATRINFLTSGVDKFIPGGGVVLAGNNAFVASDTTLTAGDMIDGDVGNDTLILHVGSKGNYAVPANLMIKNLETAQISGDAAITLNASAWTGLNKLNLIESGGDSVRISASTQLSVNDKALGAGSIRINGGSNIEVTANSSMGGNIAIGTETAPTGTVTVTDTVTSSLLGENKIGDITVNGGSKIEISQKHLGRAPINSSVNVTGTAITKVVNINNAVDGSVANNVVNVTDVNAGSAKPGTISTIGVIGFTDLTINDNALNRLNVASAGGNIVLNNTGLNEQNKKTTLELSLAGSASIDKFTDAGNNLTHLDLILNGIGNAVLKDISANNLQSLAITGQKGNLGTLNLGLADAANLKNIVIAGTANVILDTGNLGVEQIDTSAINGRTELSFDGAVTSLIGSHVQNNNPVVENKIFVKGSVVSKPILLGSQNDIVTLTPTLFFGEGQLDGGEGLDTLKLGTAAAAALTNNIANNERISHFEQLVLDNSASDSGNQTINLGGLGDLTDVYSNNGNPISLLNVSNQITLHVTGDGNYSLANPDMGDGFVDGLNFSLEADIAKNPDEFSMVNLNANATHNITLTSATNENVTLLGDSISSIHLQATTGVLNLGVNSLALQELVVESGIGSINFAVGALKTALNITVNGVIYQNTIDLTATNQGVTYDTGAGDDKIIVGDGQNTIRVNSQTTEVVLDSPSSGLNVYTTIAEAGSFSGQRSGGRLKITFADQGTESFKSTKINLAGNASLQDYANAAVHQTGNGSVNGVISWFQFQGDTYLVENRHDASASNGGFLNGTDIVVKLVGLVDLQNAHLTGATLALI